MTTARQIPRLFDLDAQLRNRSRAAPGYGEFDFLKREAALRMADRLDVIRRDFPLCVDLGCHDGTLTRALGEGGGAGKTGTVIQADTALRFAVAAGMAGPAAHIDFARLPFAVGRFDAVFSCLALHGVDDLPGLMVQAARLLKPDGLFLASLLGGTSLQELRAVLLEAEQRLYGGAGPRVVPMADIRDLGALPVRAGLALPVADADRLEVDYADIWGLMRDLRGMGEQNALLARSRRPVSRAFFELADTIYKERFANPKGRIVATFEIVTLTAWAPHASQQRPLRPGSAKHRLADQVAAGEAAEATKTTKASGGGTGAGDADGGGSANKAVGRTGKSATKKTGGSPRGKSGKGAD